MKLSEFVMKRLLQGVLLVFVVSLLVFSMMYLMPGNPIDLMTDRKVSEEHKNTLKVKYGLHLPLHQQYFNWIRNALQGNFGESIRTKMSVNQMFKQRIPVTLKLCGTALLIEMLIGIPIGLLAAYKRDSFFDRFVISSSLFFTAIPSFWLSVLLILIFGVTLKILPLSGFESARNFILPITAMVLGGIASTIRMTKTEVLDVLNEKFVLTAYAKGLPRKQVMVKHVLYNSLILVIIILFLSIPWIISGAVIIESIFVIPGMGGLMTQSIINQDFMVVQACVLVISVLTVVCNLLCDIITAMLDPRIRISMGGDRG